MSSLWIHPPNPPESTGIGFSFGNPEGLDHFIEQSDDLVHRTCLNRFWPGDNSRESVPLPIDAGRRFYRLSAHPASENEWVTAAADTALADYRIFRSAAAGRPVSYHVFLPPAYAAEPDRRFPVLYWLHGSGAGIAGVPPLSRFFGDAMDADEIPPMIIVFPNGLPKGMWCDSKDGATPMEAILPDDLSIRIIVGDEDSMLDNNRVLHTHFTTLGIAHEYRELPGIGHNPLRTPQAIGPANWAFCRTVFGD